MTNKSEIEQLAEQHKYHGGTILFSNIHCSGWHTNGYGNGSMDISLARVDGDVKWLGVADVKFTNPTPEQIISGATASLSSEEGGEYVTQTRSLSFNQARYVQNVLIKALDKHFGSEIPCDEEITDHMQRHFAEQEKLSDLLTKAKDAMPAIEANSGDNKKEFEAIKAFLEAIEPTL